MINYTKTTLQKLISIFEDQEYTIRFEKGMFKSGYALVHDRKIVVVNKFFDTEARINTLLEILDQIEVNEALLDKKNKSFFNMLVKSALIKTGK